MSAASPRPASPRRPRCGAPAAILVLAALVAWAAPARAQDAPPPADPWPLPTPAPAQGADGARATIDALDARRQALSTRRVADVLDESVPVPDAATTPVGPGRTALPPAVAVRGLKEAARRGEQAQARTVPEMVEVLAGVAFDGGVVAHDRPVVAGSDRKVDRIFRGGFRPASVDDRPFVLQPSRLDRLRRLPPAPPPPPVTAAPPSPTDVVVRGVRIDVDEALLRRAMGASEPPAQRETLDALERDLLAARDGGAVVARLARFTDAQEAAVLGALDGEGGLRRVSLRALLDAAPATADPAATCGGLTRVLGVACDPSGADVALVGVVEAGAPAVPLDALTVALRTVWREGRVPGCSLDPDPKNPGGPQAVRVLGVPADSRFGKTMLDADYAMKQIVGRAPGAPKVEGVVDLFAALGDTGGEIGSQRFWLTPVPLARGDVLTAPDTAAALFTARVRVRTEAMQTASIGGETGTGKAGAAGDACARSLSARYDELARAVPVFAELRTLFDVVTCAQVLRVLAPSHPLLARAADRPYVRVDLPKTYAGITVTEAVHGTAVTLMGGCDLDARVTDRCFLDARHPAFAALARRGADGALPGARPVPTGTGSARDERQLAGLAAQAAEKWLDAADVFSDLLADEPADPELLGLRAASRSRAGDPEGALLDATEAVALDPASPGPEALLRHLQLEAGDPAALEGMRPAVAEVLETTLSASAAAAALARRFDRAVPAALQAVKVRPTSAAAHVVLDTVLWLSGDVETASRAVQESLAAVPDDPSLQKVAGWIALQRGDARAAVSAFSAAVARGADAEGLGMRAVARAVDGDLAGAVADARAAVAADPSDFATGLAVQTMRALAVYGPERARRIARGQLMLPPDAQLSIYEGMRAQQTGDAAGAVSAFTRALETLAQSGMSPAARAEALADETVSFLLARSLMDRVGAEPDATERIEALASALERAHPGWVSPRWLRALAALKRGDARGAIDGFAACRGLDPQGDGLLAQAMPADGRSVAQVLSILETSIVLRLPEQEGPPAMKAALERLVAAYAGTPSAPAAEGVKLLFDAMERGGKSDDAAMLARVRTLLAALPPPGTPVAPAEAMVQATFLGMAAGLEADRPDGDPRTALSALRALAPTPDVYDTVTNVVVSARQQVATALLGQLLAPLGVVGRGIEDAAAEDPDEAQAWVRHLFADPVERAASLGDPVLAWVVAETAEEAAEGARTEGLARRLSRVEAVLAVATDPAKVARLEATRATLTQARTEHEARALARTTAARRAFVATLASPADAKLLAALLAGARDRAAASGRAGALAPGPEDARLAAEQTIAACARALGLAPAGGGR